VLYNIIFTMIWLYCRTSLGMAVPMVRNGKLILRLMVAASAQRERPNIGVKRIQRMLAWLPAYDRRDVMTVKYVLDYMVTKFADMVGDDDEDPFEVIPISKLRVSRVSRSDASVSGVSSATNSGDVKIKPTAEARAVALSVYFYALLNESPGDKVKEGVSLRQWLADVGIRMFESHTGIASVDEDELDGGAGMPSTIWLDNHPGEEEVKEELTKLVPLTIDHSEKKVSWVKKRSMAKGKYGLKVWELNQLGFWMLRGASCSILTPVGSMWLEDANLTNWTLLKAVKLNRPDARKWGSPFFILLTMYFVLETIINIHIPWTNPAWQQEPDSPYIYIQLFPPLLLILAIGMILGFKLCADALVIKTIVTNSSKFGTSCRHHHTLVPLPLRQQGKVEYALVWIVAAVLIGWGLRWFDESTLQDATDTDAYIAINRSWVILFFVLSGYEAFLATYHAIGSMLGHGAVRFVFELTSTPIEKHCTIK